MTFNFSFQRILNLTESEKNQLESEYGRIYKLFEEIAEKLFNLMKKKEQISETFQTKIKQRTSVALFREQQSYLNSLDGLINSQQEEYNKVRITLEKYRSLLVEKSVEVKKYEKLKERQYSDFQHEARKKDAKRLDETAVSKFLKR